MDKLKIVWELLKETFAAWQADNASRLAAALAYYSIFALAPLLIITISVAGVVFGERAAEEQISTQLEETVGPEAAEFIEAIVANAAESRSGTSIASILGIAILLFAASNLFNELQATLNTIWDVTPATEGGIMGLIKQRLFLFAMVFSLGLVLILALSASVAVSVVGNFIDLSGFLQFINMAIFLSIVTLLFAVIYKFLPDVKIAWRDVWIGAFVTALLFNLGRWLISLYLAFGNVGSAFGAAGTLVILLIWIYYSAQIYLLGAEFTKVYAMKYGSKIVPVEPEDAGETDEETSEQPQAA